jgi:phospholipid/cholesterol/gamma-HCH transport system substrate-binding protein
MSDDTGARGSEHVADDHAPMQTRKVKIRGKSFSSRNPTPIGAIGLVLILVILWAAFNASSLPLIGGGTEYTAMFTEAAGLAPGDDVRSAGVNIGSVDSISLDQSKAAVKVTFKVKSGFVGNQSKIYIDIRTLLGAKYLAIDSIGSKAQPPGTAIPKSRTHSPFDIYPVFTKLTKKIDKINTDQLAQSLNVLSNDFSGTPATVKPLLTGLTRLSNVISGRDTQLAELLTQTTKVTGVLKSRDAELTDLITQGGLLLQELNDRRDAIHSLLVNATTLSTQLEGLVADNQKTLGPMLTNLHGVLKLLQDNQDSLDQGLSLLGPFYRVFNNTIGNGRWFDNYICNLNIPGLLGTVALGGTGIIDQNDTCPVTK